MKINKNSLNITKAMKQLSTLEIPIDNKLEVFIFPINSNQFDYRAAVDKLLESVADFALSRKTKEYLSKHGSMRLSKEVRTKFKDWQTNTGELGEFLLFCFLEGHLRAPKILSKLELKTSSEMYVHGADGLHYLKLPNGNFQLIFGESKLYKSVNDGLREAFKSIRDFKQSINSGGNETSGITFERSLMSSNLDRETFTEEEKEFLSSIIYPSQEENIFEVDDAFGIFVGYEVDFENERRNLRNDEFREQIKKDIIQKIELQKKYIEKYISKDSKVSILLKTQVGLEIKTHTINPYRIDFETMYNDDFLEVHNRVKNSLTNDTKGVVLFHGIAGSGKTNYIKWLTSQILNKKFIFVPTTMIGSLTDPAFIGLLIGNKNSVLVLEDCENYISERASFNSNTDVVSSILNIADGMLSDVLECQLICTFNSDISKIDSALLRKGRLIAEYKFKELSIEKCNKYLQSTDKQYSVSKPHSLAELANIDAKEFKDNSKEAKIGFK